MSTVEGRAAKMVATGENCVRGKGYVYWYTFQSQVLGDPFPPTRTLLSYFNHLKVVYSYFESISESEEVKTVIAQSHLNV